MQLVKNLVILSRIHRGTKEKWTEFFNVNEIVCAKEHRVSQGVYNNDPGKRVGYDIYLKGGHTIWVSDVEYEEICNKILGFQLYK